MKVILLMAITVDGKTGKDADHFVDWTDREDKRLFVEITRKAGVLIMGSRTFDTIGQPLAGRKNIILTRNPDRKSLWDDLEFSGEKPSELLRKLSRRGFSEVVLAGGPTINTLFAKDKLIDEIIVTISPKIFGRGTSLFTEEISMDLILKSTERRGEHLVCVTYAVNHTTVEDLPSEA